jgi:hypothetical protein
MKAFLAYSGNTVRRGYGRCPFVSIQVEPETEEEKAILRMLYCGQRRVDVWESGNISITTEMPRGKN